MTPENNHPPIIAILRGLETDEAVDIADALLAQSINMMEVPLNSPHPFRTIKRLAQTFGDRISLGAGTVLTPEQVIRLASTGAQYAIAPNLDSEVVKACQRSGLEAIPGVFTPSEVFKAVNLGVSKVKLFPISSLGVGYIKALKAVLPEDLQLFPVGGVNASNIAEYLATGVAGVGVGGDIFKPGDTAEDVSKKAMRLTEAIDQAS